MKWIKTLFWIGVGFGAGRYAYLYRKKESLNKEKEVKGKVEAFLNKNVEGFESLDDVKKEVENLFK